jgi:hypothetical protein
VAIKLTGLQPTEQRHEAVLVVSTRNESLHAGPDRHCETESGANSSSVERTLHIRNSVAVYLAHGIKGFEAHGVLYSR